MPLAKGLEARQFGLAARVRTKLSRFRTFGIASHSHSAKGAEETTSSKDFGTFDISMQILIIEGVEESTSSKNFPTFDN